MRAIDLSGKTALVTGVANHRSLAWAIAQALGDAGCRLAFTYQGDRLRESVTDLASAYPGSPVLPCDVSKDDEMDAVFSRLEQEWGKLHVFIHSIAFAPRNELEGEFRKTTRAGLNGISDWGIASGDHAASLATSSSVTV